MLAEPGVPQQTRAGALHQLVEVAAANLIGADFASISIRHNDGTLQTMAATHPLAHELDEVQYRLSEGPCLAAVAEARFVLINDMTDASEFPRYAPQAAARGVGSQLAMQLVQDGEHAGLNVYALRRDAFDHTTVMMAELFAAQAAMILGYAKQVEGLGYAVHSRQDIGTAVGMVMERYGLDQSRAFGYLVRLSQTRNVKLRLIARELISGTFSESVTEGRQEPHPYPTGGERHSSTTGAEPEAMIGS